MQTIQGLNIYSFVSVRLAATKKLFQSSRKPDVMPVDEECRGSPEIVSTFTYKLPGLYNFRDIGGHVASGQKVIRHGLIFRSANLDLIHPLDLQYLRQSLGICCIFDLRSHDDCRTVASTKYKGGMTVHHVPAMNWEKSQGPLQEHFSLLSQDVVTAFMVIYKHLSVQSAPAFAAIFTHMIENPGRPFIIHCDLGKDRTGIFIAVLLMVLGVPDADIVEDYHRTEGQIDGYIGPKSEKYRHSALLLQPIHALENHFLAPRKVMKSFLAFIRTVYGDVMGYMEYLGFGVADIERIRQSALLPLACASK